MVIAQSTTLPSSILSSNFFTTCSSLPPPINSSLQAIKVTSLIRCSTPDPAGTQQGGGGGGAGSSTSKIFQTSPTHGLIHDKNKKRHSRFDGYENVTLGAYAEFINTSTNDHHLPLIQWPHHHHHLHEVDSLDQIKDRVERVKSMLTSMEDGEISVSPYDTAWVALVEDTEGGAEKKPRFPESLEWIGENQLGDGSWGDEYIFLAHDRILNTLACVIALTWWNVHPHKCHKGMEFIEKNWSKLGDEKEEHMLIGFEVAFPSLMEMARGLGIHLLDLGVVQAIYAKRSLKLSRIPLEIVHRKPTTLLHSLEGMSGLDWEKLMKLQSKDGSFLFSPSSTAFALMNTKDLNCFSYLNTTLHKFNGGVPNVYPVDLFEHIWVVDRLQRLGISRFFDTEIKGCMDYVYRNWSEKGICWARNSEVQDIDDTAMGFRLLRLHGYHVSADVFKNFKKDGGEFICFAGQSTHAVTGMFNLYRASQVQYPGETILEEARDFSSMYLREKQASNQLLDKWIIQKDLPGEVGYALDLPWYASLPRIETRIYIEQYGGDDDVWIGKTLYRMPYVNNNIYLELAKLDYNTCQAVHLLEWDSVRKWYTDYNLYEFELSQGELLRLYFVAAASIYEPERSNERLAWAKTSAMVAVIAGYFGRQSKASYEQRRLFAEDFLMSYGSFGLPSIERRGQGLMGLLLSMLHQLSLDTMVAHGVDIRQHLRQAWGRWMLAWAEEGDRYKCEAELVVRTIQVCSKDCCLETAQDQFGYNLILETTNTICHQLGHFSLQTYTQNNPQEEEVEAKEGEGKSKPMMLSEVNSNMQKLMELVLSSYTDIDHNIRQSFLVVARSYYYSTYCSPMTINSHLTKVLFERVV